MLICLVPRGFLRYDTELLAHNCEEHCPVHTIGTLPNNRAAETKKFDKTAKYEVLTITSSKVMSKKRYFEKCIFLYIKKIHSAGYWNTLFKESEIKEMWRYQPNQIIIFSEDMFSLYGIGLHNKTLVLEFLDITLKYIQR